MTCSGVSASCGNSMKRNALCWKQTHSGAAVSLAGLECFFADCRFPGTVGAFEGNLWAQVGCYCAGQAIGYVSVVLAPDWLGRLRQRRYEERVLSGREKFRSRKEVLEQRAEAQEAQRRAKELRRAKK